jgi:hypothetical protein
MARAPVPTITCMQQADQRIGLTVLANPRAAVRASGKKSAGQLKLSWSDLHLLFRFIR